MSVPSLKVFVNGQPEAVTGDQLDTFQQTCDSASDLRNFVGITGIQIFMRGYAAPNDGGQGEFYWNASGSGPDDDGITNIVPNGAAAGCWTRIVTTYVGSLITADVVAASMLGTVTGKLKILNSDGSTAGYLPIYGLIT